MRVGLDLPPQQRVYGGFFVYSFCMGSLPPRLPDLQRMMQIEEGPLGFGLIGAAAGTLVSLSFFGPILERIGYRRSILTMIPLLALLYAIASFATGPLSFFLLFPVGIVIGGIEIILNLEADRTEHMVAYRIMNRAHAFWSFGFFSAGIISALIAQSGLSPQIHLFLMVPLVVRVRTNHDHCRFLVTSEWLDLGCSPVAPPLPQHLVAISIVNGDPCSSTFFAKSPRT